jgi:hypothetical protein
MHACSSLLPPPPPRSTQAAAAPPRPAPPRAPARRPPARFCCVVLLLYHAPSTYVRWKRYFGIAFGSVPARPRSAWAPPLMAAYCLPAPAWPPLNNPGQQGANHPLLIPYPRLASSPPPPPALVASLLSSAARQQPPRHGRHVVSLAAGLRIPARSAAPARRGGTKQSFPRNMTRLDSCLPWPALRQRSFLQPGRGWCDPACLACSLGVLRLANPACASAGSRKKKGRGAGAG